MQTTLSSRKSGAGYGNAAGGHRGARLNPFTITRPTFKPVVQKLAFACGNFPIVREFICSQRAWNSAELVEKGDPYPKHIAEPFVWVNEAE